MREMKFKYLWKGDWFYIDLYKDNTASKFEAYESVNKTSPFCQFTGSKIKQENQIIKIWEGDILQCKHSEQSKESEFYLEKGVVVFRNSGFEFNGIKLNDWYTDNDWCLREQLYVYHGHFNVPDFYYKRFDIERLGNIFEHKHLLK
jgi:hypothetical protein